MREHKNTFGQWLLLSIGALGVSLSLILLIAPPVKAATASAWCNEDEYVDCWGGTYCTAVDNVGCKCYTKKGGAIVMQASCSDLGGGGGGGEPILD